MGCQKANVGAKRQMGRHKGIWGAKKANVGCHQGKCVAIKADGVPLRQICCHKGRWGATKANLGAKKGIGAP